MNTNLVLGIFAIAAITGLAYVAAENNRKVKLVMGPIRAEIN